MTLVELLVGLAVLGTILGTVLVARSRHQRQLNQAQRRLEAVAAAERLLERWWNDPEQMPRDQSGSIDGFTWRLAERPLLERVGDDEFDPLARMKIVTLRITDPQILGAEATLASVELVLPPRPPANERQADDERTVRLQER
ncbi:type II secretion system protein [Fontivita pretiosa]|uniref:type II secretion system protein n=1 Tax=Fontivita pretiosa TaxID=2989684 RepID=UPI003D16B4D7